MGLSYVTLALLFSSNLKCFDSLMLPPSVSMIASGIQSQVNINEVVDYASSLVDILKEAALPTSMEDLVAIGVSEGVSGLIGGLASREVENLVGDVKKDAFVTDGVISAIYFGVRALFRSLAQVAGLPRPVAIFFADIAGSIASESAKAAGRAASSMQARENEIDCQANEKDELCVEVTEINYPGNEGSLQLNEEIISKIDFQNNSVAQVSFATTLLSSVSLAEIIVDVTKWVAYDLLVQDSDTVSQLEAALCGAGAGMLAVSLLHFLQMIWTEQLALKDNVDFPTRVARAGLEGGILFLVYEATLNYCSVAFPDPIRNFMEKRFEQLLS